MKPLVVLITCLAIVATCSGAGAGSQQGHKVKGTCGQNGQVEGYLIPDVPDLSQPPENRLHFRAVDNWCAPTAAADVLVFLDCIARFERAEGVVAKIDPELGPCPEGDQLGLLASEYLAYFMCTNGEGSTDRANSRAALPGTAFDDIGVGIEEYAHWDQANPYGRPISEIPQKSSLDWSALAEREDGSENRWIQTAETLKQGVPVLVCFSYWNPVLGCEAEMVSEERSDPVTFATWGEPISSTEVLRKKDPKVPDEEWGKEAEAGIGHAVAAVGFLVGDPDGEGPLPDTKWLVVHDNWASTPRDIAIPWDSVVGIVIVQGLF